MLFRYFIVSIVLNHIRTHTHTHTHARTHARTHAHTHAQPPPSSCSQLLRWRADPISIWIELRLHLIDFSMNKDDIAFLKGESLASHVTWLLVCAFPVLLCNVDFSASDCIRVFLCECRSANVERETRAVVSICFRFNDVSAQKYISLTLCSLNLCMIVRLPAVVRWTRA